MYEHLNVWDSVSVSIVSENLDPVWELDKIIQAEVQLCDLGPHMRCENTSSTMFKILLHDFDSDSIEVMLKWSSLSENVFLSTILDSTELQDRTRTTKSNKSC